MSPIAPPSPASAAREAAGNAAAASKPHSPPGIDERGITPAGGDRPRSVGGGLVRTLSSMSLNNAQQGSGGGGGGGGGGGISGAGVMAALAAASNAKSAVMRKIHLINSTGTCSSAVIAPDET